MRKAVTVAVMPLVLLLALWGVDYAISTLVSFAEPLLTTDLSTLQTKQTEIYIEMNKQLLTLATLVFAGVGLYLNVEAMRQEAIGRKKRNVLVGIVLMAAFSLYMGYLSYDKMVWMLSNNFFNLNTPLLYWFRTLQFWSFVVSILAFSWLWLDEIGTE